MKELEQESEEKFTRIRESKKKKIELRVTDEEKEIITRRLESEKKRPESIIAAVGLSILDPSICYSVL